MPGKITQYLQRLDPNDPASYNPLFRLVYDELRRIARDQFKRRPGTTLNATSLVNECFLKLRQSEHIELKNHEHFYGVAVLAMRQIVTDYARARKAQKRGGDAPHVSIDEVKDALEQEATAAIRTDEEAENLIAIDEALERYGHLDPRGKEVFEYCYYMNLPHEQIAGLLDISTRTVQRAKRRTRAWLRSQIAARPDLVPEAGS